MSATTADPAQIERELDETRSRIGGHLDELQSRLSPGQLLDDMVARFRDGGGGEFGRNLLDSVKTNPLPAALTGIGLVWLMASGVRGGDASMPRASTWRSDAADRLRAAEYGVQRSDGETEHSYSERLADARGQAMGVMRGAQETASDYARRVSDALSSFGRGMGDAAESLGDTVAQGGRATGDLAASIGDSPALLGALGLAAGALLGTLLPISEQEEIQLGGAARRLRAQAEDAAQDLYAKSSEAASRTMQAGREAASQEGLTGRSAGEYVDAALSGELAEGASRTIHKSMQAGDESLRAQWRSDERGPEAGAERRNREEPAP